MPDVRHQFKTAEELQAFAQEFAGTLPAGAVLALVGPLGSGKTTFTQGLARGLAAQGDVVSPTFTYAREHAATVAGTPGTLYHIDAYRLPDADALVALGFADWLADPHGIIVVEWAEKVRAALPPRTRFLTFAYGAAQDERTVTIT